jgi:hypothetical protein
MLIVSLSWGSSFIASSSCHQHCHSGRQYLFKLFLYLCLCAKSVKIYCLYFLFEHADQSLSQWWNWQSGISVKIMYIFYALGESNIFPILIWIYIMFCFMKVPSTFIYVCWDMLVRNQFLQKVVYKRVSVQKKIVFCKVCPLYCFSAVSGDSSFSQLTGSGLGNCHLSVGRRKGFCLCHNIQTSPGVHMSYPVGTTGSCSIKAARAWSWSLSLI